MKYRCLQGINMKWRTTMSMGVDLKSICLRRNPNRAKSSNIVDQSNCVPTAETASTSLAQAKSGTPHAVCLGSVCAQPYETWGHHFLLTYHSLCIFLIFSNKIFSRTSFPSNRQLYWLKINLTFVGSEAKIETDLSWVDQNQHSGDKAVCQELPTLAPSGEQCPDQCCRSMRCQSTTNQRFTSETIVGRHCRHRRHRQEKWWLRLRLRHRHRQSSLQIIVKSLTGKPVVQPFPPN